MRVLQIIVFAFLFSSRDCSCLCATFCCVALVEDSTDGVHKRSFDGICVMLDAQKLFRCHFMWTHHCSLILVLGPIQIGPLGNLWLSLWAHRYWIHRIGCDRITRRRGWHIMIVVWRWRIIGHITTHNSFLTCFAQFTGVFNSHLIFLVFHF